MRPSVPPALSCAAVPSTELGRPLFGALVAQADEPEVTDLAFIAFQIGVITLVALVVSLSLRPVLRRLIRRLAGQAAETSGGRWRVRVQRSGAETADLAEQRRQQRIDASAFVLARLAGIVVWTIAALAVLHVLEIDAVLALSGAGFLGAGLAFGGQHSVNDFLTGLQILLEDRFGEGDRLVVTVNDSEIEATVQWVGAFTTRLESDSSTVYVANRHLDRVVNLSQTTRSE